MNRKLQLIKKKDTEKSVELELKNKKVWSNFRKISLRFFFGKRNDEIKKVIQLPKNKNKCNKC